MGSMVDKELKIPLFRELLGQVLRDLRRQQQRTLRQVAADAQVSLGYLSEVERGQKEASSELLVNIAQALNTPLAVVVREVAIRMAIAEGLLASETKPVEAKVKVAI